MKISLDILENRLSQIDNDIMKFSSRYEDYGDSIVVFAFLDVKAPLRTDLFYKGDEPYFYQEGSDYVTIQVQVHENSDLLFIDDEGSDLIGRIKINGHKEILEVIELMRHSGNYPEINNSPVKSFSFDELFESADILIPEQDCFRVVPLRTAGEVLQPESLKSILGSIISGSKYITEEENKPKFVLADLNKLNEYAFLYNGYLQTGCSMDISRESAYIALKPAAEHSLMLLFDVLSGKETGEGFFSSLFDALHKGTSYSHLQLTLPEDTLVQKLTAFSNRNNI